MDGQGVMKIDSVKQFNEIQAAFPKTLIAVHFTAKWSSHCQQVHDVLCELKKQHPQKMLIAEVEAEDCTSLSQKFEVVAVPTCVLLRGGDIVSRIEGVDVQGLCEKIEQQANAEKDIESLLKFLINQSPVMVFMKGTAMQPKCGFSKTLVSLLQQEGVQFESFDILTNEEVRQGLKEFSNWPTYPQVYVRGELIGGLDIVKELIESGEFKTIIPRAESLEEKLKKLINQDRVMLFMKGSPNAPKCGFSKTIVEILKAKGLQYGHFDILTNDEVRQNLKVLSNWPTYPQLYVKGDLVGGLDIVKELEESGELDKMLIE